MAGRCILMEVDPEAFQKKDELEAVILPAEQPIVF
jgi:hypothetical protein